MIVIRVFKMLDHNAVSVSWYRDGQPPNAAGNEQAQPLAYQTFADMPDGSTDDVTEMLRATLETAESTVAVFGGWSEVV